MKLLLYITYYCELFLGFDVEIYGGAVYGKNNQLSEKNGHIFSVVTIDGHKYVADVAFAERSPDDVLPLIYDTEIKTGTSMLQKLYYQSILKFYASI